MQYNGTVQQSQYVPATILTPSGSTVQLHSYFRLMQHPLSQLHVQQLK